MQDYFLNGEAHGELANAALHINEYRTNAVLRYDEWKAFDEVVLKAAREPLVGVADLKSRGLVYNIPNGLASTVLQYEDVGELAPAEMSMDGITRGNNDRPEYSIKYLPLPITHYDFQINDRVLRASRKGNMPLDTTTAELAARQVSLKLEDTLFNGTDSYAYGQGTIYGYTDFPDRNTYTMGTAWTSLTGEQILAELLAMIQLSINAKHYGPWMLYVPTTYHTHLDEDFKANSDLTIRQRLLEVDGIIDIKTAHRLDADNVVLVQMTGSTARMVTGLPFTNMEWQTQGRMLHHFKVMTIDVPQLRADQYGNCGIVHTALDV